MVRLQVTLDKNEADLRAQWAASEMRDPRDQIRFIVRERLIERGLLPADISAQPLPTDEGTHVDAHNERNVRA